VLAETSARSATEGRAHTMVCDAMHRMGA
jgi:hypothetical protein